MSANHAPGGDDLAIVLGQVERDLDGAGFDVTALPREIKLVPFGQAKPINP